jgi:hypothetical protein
MSASPGPHAQNGGSSNPFDENRRGLRSQQSLGGGPVQGGFGGAWCVCGLSLTFVYLGGVDKSYGFLRGAFSRLASLGNHFRSSIILCKHNLVQSCISDPPVLLNSTICVLR